MKPEKLETIKRTDIRDNEDCYSLSDIKKVADKVDTLIPEKLIVSIDGEVDGWLNIVFFEWTRTSDNDEYYCELCRISGPSGYLRECRHTYFVNDGYIFYMNREVMIAVVDYLTLYYDMD